MNILIIRLSSLGDVVLSCMAANAVKQNNPKNHIALVTKEQFSGISKLCPSFDEVLTLHAPYGIRELKKLVNEIKKQSWDFVIDLHSNPRSSLISKLSGAKEIIRYHKRAGKRRLLVAKSKLKRIAGISSKSDKLQVLTAVQFIAKNNWHVADAYLETLNKLGIEAKKEVPFLNLPRKNCLAGQINNVKKEPQKEMIIGFHPAGRWFTKRWPVDYYIELGKTLKQKYRAKIQIFGDEADHETAQKLAEALNGENLAGKTSIYELACELNKCKLLVCGDTGPMHIALGLGIPVIAIFGPTVPEFGFFPFGRSDRIVSVDLPCRPCSLHGGDNCPIGTHLCMRSILPDDVLKAAVNLIS